MHNNFKDCWIILDSKVYNVTGYVNEHPGGSFKLLECSGTGKDYIKQFNEEGHSKMAINKLQQF